MTSKPFKKVWGKGKRIIGSLLLLGALATPVAVYFAPQYAVLEPVAENILHKVGDYLVGDNETGN